jgi:hypothetical protein
MTQRFRPLSKLKLVGIGSVLLCAVLIGGVSVFAATGVPQLISHQGRLLDVDGNLLGGSGTEYCFKFAIYDQAPISGGTKLWPTGAPSAMDIVVTNGVFNASIGDTASGGDQLDFDFESNREVYLQVQVAAQTGGTCGDETFETLSPRQRIQSSGYAINAATLRGFTASQSADLNEIPVLTNGDLILSDASPAIRANGSATLTLQEGVTGNLQFFNASSYITSAGSLKLAGGASISTNIELTGYVDSHWRPLLDNTYTLGDATHRWANIFATNASISGNLEVNIASVSQLYVGGSLFANYWSRSGSNTYLANSGDNVGIGNATPEQKLMVAGNILASSSGNVDLIIKSTSASGSWGQFILRSAGANNRFDISPTRTTLTEYTPRFSIASSGFVGIYYGHSAGYPAVPSAVLHVQNGDAVFDGGITDRPTLFVDSSHGSATHPVARIRGWIDNAPASALLRLEIRSGAGATPVGYLFDVLGDIQGDADNTDVNRVFSIYDGTGNIYAIGNVGIGTQSPVAKLDVRSSIAGSFDLLNVASSSGTSFLRVTKGGNVGIGTTIPDARLNINLGADTTSNALHIYSGNGGYAGDYINVENIIGANKFVVTSAGSVGIKGVRPDSGTVGLEVGGDIVASYSAGGGGAALILNNTSAGNTDQKFTITTSPTEAVMVLNGAGSSLMSIASRGATTINALFGTTSPALTLNIASPNISSTGLLVNTSDGGYTGNLTEWQTLNNRVAVLTYQGNLGLGSSTPETKLEVAGTASISGATTLRGLTYTWPSTHGSSGYFLQNNGSGTLSWSSVSGFGVASDSLDFDEFVDSMTLDANLTVASAGYSSTWRGNFYHTQGNVGIGTTTTTAKLTVLGANGVGGSAPSVLTVTGGTGASAAVGYTGGGITLTGGTGGNSTSGFDYGGSGGSIVLQGGTGGTAIDYNSGIGGSIYIRPGISPVSAYDPTAGNIYLADVPNQSGTYNTGNRVFIGPNLGVLDAKFTITQDSETDYGYTMSVLASKQASSGGASVIIATVPAQNALSLQSCEGSSCVYKYPVVSGGKSLILVGGEAASASSGIQFWTWSNGNFVGERMRLAGYAGNLGIGDTSPDARLEVVGSMSLDLLNLSSSMNADGDLLTFTSGGNLGIGTPAVDSKLEVAGTASISGATTLRGVTYTWPSTQGGASTYLINNGSGTLSWATVAAGVASDGLDFDEFVDAMTLDANLTVASAGYTTAWNSWFASSLKPSVTDTYSLGTSALRWADLYLASGSLHIGNASSEAVIDYDDAFTVSMTSAPAGGQNISLALNRADESPASPFLSFVSADDPTTNIEFTQTTTPNDGRFRIEVEDSTRGLSRLSLEPGDNFNGLRTQSADNSDSVQFSMRTDSPNSSWTVTNSGAIGTISLDDLGAEISINNGSTTVNTSFDHDRVLFETGVSMSGSFELTANASISGTTTLAGITYTWPSSQGGANTYLKNNGSGTLSWFALNSLASDGIDFDEIVDSMTLDANLTVASAGYSTTWRGNFYQTQGNVGIGTTTALAQLHIVEQDGGTTRIMADQFSTDTTGSVITLRKGRGSPTSISLVISGDTLGQLNFQGHNGSTFTGNNAAYVQAVAAENFGLSAQGTYLSFGTTPIGATSSLPRMRITSEGNVGIGSVGDEAKLEVAGTASISGILYANGGCVGCVAADTLDYTEFSDAMTLDATTSTSLGAYDLIFNTNGAGNLVVKDNGRTLARFASNGWLEIGVPIRPEGSLTNPSIFRPVLTISKTASSSNGVVPFYSQLYMTSTGTGSGAYIDAQIASANANNFSGTITGLTAFGQHRGTGNATGEIVGIQGYAIDNNPNGRGTVTEGIGIRGTAQISSSVNSQMTYMVGVLGENFVTAGRASASIAVLAKNPTINNGIGFTNVNIGLMAENVVDGTNSNINVLIASSSTELGAPFVQAPAGNWSIYNSSTRDNYFAGNLGIGTKTPTTLLEVAGTASISGVTTLNGVGYTWPSAQGGAGYFLQNNGSGTLQWSSISGIGVASDQLDFDEFADAMTLDANLMVASTSSGFTTQWGSWVGIGTAPVANAILTLAAKDGTVEIRGSDDGAFNMYAGTATAMYIGANATAQLGILANGNVGFFDTSPETNFEVAGVASINNVLLVQSGTASVSGSFEIGSDTANAYLFRSTGASWSQPFELRNTASISGTTTLAGVSYTWPSAQGAASTYLQNNGSGTLTWGAISGTLASDGLDFDEFIDSMTLDATTTVDLNNFNYAFTGTGNVGLGTSAPVYDFEVASISGGNMALSRDDATITADELIGKLDFAGYDTDSTTQDNFASIRAYAAQNITTNAAAGYLSFYTTGTTAAGSPLERMRIDAAGNVGINDTTPLYKLAVNGTASISGDLAISGVAYDWPNTQGGANTYLKNNGSGTLSWATVTSVTSDSMDFDEFVDAMTLDATTTVALNSFNYAFTGTGNVGIGDTTPEAKFEIANGRASISYDSGASWLAALAVQKIGTAVDDKFVALFGGAVSNTSDIAENSNVSIWQQNSTSNNYSTLNFLNAAGNDAAYVGAQYVNHTAYPGQVGNLVFATANSGNPTVKMTLTAAGNLGIGTTSAVAKLSFGTLAGTPAIHLYEGGVGARAGFGIQSSELQSFIGAASHWSWNSGGDLQTSGTNEVMRLTSAGNLGIGTTAPSRLFEAYSATSNLGRIRITGTSQTGGGYSGLEFYGKDGVTGTFGGGIFREQSNDSINIFTGADSANPRITIADATGNVGILDSVPGARLSFGTGSIGVPLVHYYDGGAGSDFGVGTNSGEVQSFGTSGGRWTWNSGGDLQATGVNELMRLEGSGNLGIGETTPLYKLAVNGTASVSGGFFGAGLANCTGSNFLQWNSGTGLFGCAAGGGSGSATLQVKESGGTYTNTSSISFNAAHFTVSFSAPQALIDLDWGSGGPASLSQSETVTGAWTFTNNIEVSGGYASLSNALFVASNGNVGIGTTTPATLLDVIGTASVSSNFEIGANLYRFTSAGASWSKAFETAAYASASAYFGAGLTDCDQETQTLNWDAATGRFTCLEDGGGSGGISSDSLDFDELVDGTMTLDGNLTIASATYTVDWKPYFASSLIPATDDTYDLGTSARRWRDLYLGPASLHLGTDGNEALIGYDTSNNFLSFKPDGTTTKLSLFDSGNASLSGSLETTGYASASAYFGGGLVDCDSTASKLVWDTTTGRFSCSADASGGNGGFKVVDRAYAQTEVSSTTTESTVYSYTIPGGLLTANAQLRLWLGGSVIKNLAGGYFTVRVKLGSTTVAETQVTAGNNSAGTREGGFYVLLSNTGTTSSQKTYFEGSFSDSNNNSAYEMSVNGYGTSSVDMTQNQTLTVTVQPSAISTGLVWTKEIVTAELVDNAGTATFSGTGVTGQVTFWNNSASISGDNALFWDNTNKRLGIGTTAPSYKLSIAGTASISSGLFGAGLTDCDDDGQYLRWTASGSDAGRFSCSSVGGSGAGWTDSGTSVYLTTTSDNVGIGTTSPGSKLVIAQSTLGNGVYVYSTSTNAGTMLAQDTNGLLIEQYGVADADDNIVIKSSTIGDGNTYSLFTINPQSGFTFAGANGGNGNVGIGTTAPSQALDIYGDIALDGTQVLELTTGDLFIRAGGASDLIAFQPQSGTYVAQFDADGDVYLGGTSANTTPKLFIGGSSGNVGIGSTTPTQALDVNGSVNIANGLFGAGLSNCANSTTDKLIWSSATGQFSCATDQNSGGGSSGGALNIREFGVTDFGSRATASFVAGQFALVASGSSDVTIKLDWGAGGPASLSEAERVTGAWEFTTTASFGGNVYMPTTATNLGIGTTAPAAKIDIRGSGTGTNAARILLSSSENYAGIAMQSDGSGLWMMSAVDNSDNLDFTYDGTSRVTFDSTGAIGINSPTTPAALDIIYSDSAANLIRLRNTSATGFSGISFTDDTTGGVQGMVGFGNGSVTQTSERDIVFLESAVTLTLRTADTERLRINSTGGVGIANMLQVGSGDTTANTTYSRFGSYTTTHSLGAGQDVMVSGLLEVDGVIYADSDLNVDGSIAVTGLGGFSGAGLIDCDGMNDKIVWDSATQYFGCSPDISGAANYAEEYAIVQTAPSTIDFDGSDFDVTASGSSVVTIRLDWINGPASLSQDEAVTGAWEFVNGASIGSNLTLNSVAYVFPNTQGGANTYLRNNGSGILTWTSVTADNGVSSDGLDFDEFKDAMTLDADTTISNNGFALTMQNASVSGNFEVVGSLQGGATTLASILVSGGASLSANADVVGVLDVTGLFIGTNASLSVNLDVIGTVNAGKYIGAGLGTCNGAGDKLTYDSATGTFGCGTDQQTAGRPASNSLDFDEFANSMTLDANTTIASNGYSLTLQTASISGDLTVRRIFGAALPNCSLEAQTLLYDSSTGTFLCGSDEQGAASAGGWTDDGTNVRLTSATDSVSIGTTTALAQFTIMAQPTTYSIVGIASASGRAYFSVGGKYGNLSVGNDSAYNSVISNGPQDRYSQFNASPYLYDSDHTDYMNANEDLYIHGSLEVDSPSFFDSTASIANALEVGGDSTDAYLYVHANSSVNGTNLPNIAAGDDRNTGIWWSSFHAPNELYFTADGHTTLWIDSGTTTADGLRNVVVGDDQTTYGVNKATIAKLDVEADPNQNNIVAFASSSGWATFAVGRKGNITVGDARASYPNHVESEGYKDAFSQFNNSANFNDPNNTSVLNSAEDLYIHGGLEVDDKVWFDSTASIANHLEIGSEYTNNHHLYVHAWSDQDTVSRPTIANGSERNTGIGWSGYYGPGELYLITGGHATLWLDVGTTTTDGLRNVVIGDSTSAYAVNKATIAKLDVEADPNQNNIVAFASSSGWATFVVGRKGNITVGDARASYPNHVETFGYQDAFSQFNNSAYYNDPNNTSVLNSAEDLYIHGGLEVDDKVFFDATASVASHLEVGGDLIFDTYGGTRPQISVGNDRNTGIFWDAVNTLSLWTNAVSRLNINPSGNVGIGTTNAPNHFYIYNTANAQELGRIVNPNAGAAAYAEFQVGNGTTAGSDALRMIAMGTGWTTNGAYVQDSGVLSAGANLSGGLSIVADEATTGEIRFYTDGAAAANRRMTIANGGNVGVGQGTSAPDAQFVASTSAGGTTNAGLFVRNDTVTTLTAFNAATLALRNPTTTNNSYSLFAMQTLTTTGAVGGTSWLAGIHEDHTNGSLDGEMAFLTRNNDTIGEVMRLTNDGNVGIGTSTPVSKLDVSAATGGLMTISRNDATVTANEVLGQINFWTGDSTVTTDKVGATIRAAAAADHGTNAAQAYLAFLTTATTVSGSPVERMRISETGNIGIGTSTTTSARLTIQGTAATGATSALLIEANGGADLFRIQDNGAASLSGNFDPSTDNTYQLGNAAYRWKDIFLGPGSLNMSSTTGTSGASANYTDAVLQFAAGSSLSLGTQAVGSGLAGSIELRTANTSRLFIGSGGNVGIGTTTLPVRFNVLGGGRFSTNLAVGNSLQAGGTATVSYSRFGTGTATHTAAGEITDSSDVFITDDLEIDGTLFADGNIVGVVNITGSGYVDAGTFYADDGALTAPSYTFSGATSMGMSRSSGQLGFNSTSTHLFAVGGTSIFQITSTGATLHVGSLNVATGYQVGGTPGVSDSCGNDQYYENIVISGGIITGGGCQNDIDTDTDLAEAFFTMDDELEPGDLVVAYASGQLDFGLTGPAAVSQQAVERSAAAYQAGVIGVYSTSPSIYMGEDLASGTTGEVIPVALAGRVPVKVTGSVKVGDRIVASDIPGVGMTAARPGMTVGIALEPTNLVASGSVQTVIVLISPSYWVPSVEDAIAGTDLQLESQYPGMFAAIISEFKNVLNIEFAQGLVKSLQGVFGEVQTDKLCVGKTCVTEEELMDLLDAQGVQPAGTPALTPDPTTTPTPDPETASPVEETTSTPAPENGSGGEPLLEPAPESAPETAPEPVQEPASEPAPESPTTP